MKRSWKTSLSGVASILVALTDIVTGIANGTPVHWEVDVTGIVTGIGLLAARDNGVSSEDVGVAPKPRISIPENEPTKT